jgi:DnaJ like chaperone protein
MQKLKFKANKVFLNETGFQISGNKINFDSIIYLGFDSLITQHKKYSKIVGVSYTSRLIFTFESNEFHISPAEDIFGFTSEKHFLDFQNLCRTIREKTFKFRLKKYLETLNSKGFYSFENLQFTKSGEIYKNGLRFLKLNDAYKEVSVKNNKIYFPVIENKRKILKGFKNKIDLPLFFDRDCFYVLLQNILGFGTKDAKLYKIKENHYFEYALRIATQLVNADGKVLKSELELLKKYFNINEKTCPNSASIFNEEIQNPTPLNKVLEVLNAKFKDKPELKDTLILGLFKIAIIDGELHKNELNLLQLIADNMNNSSFLVRLIATFQGGSITKNQSSSELNLKILGLKKGATNTEIRAAYKILVKRHHPDSLQGTGVPYSEIVKSEQLLHHIIEAYTALTT